MKRINVTKTFLPPIEDYQHYLDQIWQSGQITNQGPLLREFESRTKEFLGVSNFHFVTNGTAALQLALKALEFDGGEIITTPFSYVATTSSILWENFNPKFVDINTDTFCIDADKIEQSISTNTRGILAVHVFGYPCEVEKIEALARKYSLKVIYDSAHAFGVEYNGKSLMSYGDLSTGSFHATKLFHTIEGGCVIARDKELSEKIELMKRFGHEGDNHYRLGINAKASEFQAAMGLCNLKYVEGIIRKRKEASQIYDSLLGTRFRRPKQPSKTKYNYAYYPILANSETDLLKLIKKLNDQNIFPRRYFYPSLNTLSYLKSRQVCSVSEDVASRIMCLPLHADLGENDVSRICEIINR